MQFSDVFLKIKEYLFVLNLYIYLNLFVLTLYLPESNAGSRTVHDAASILFSISTESSQISSPFLYIYKILVNFEKSFEKRCFSKKFKWPLIKQVSGLNLDGIFFKFNFIWLAANIWKSLIRIWKWSICIKKKRNLHQFCADKGIVVNWTWTFKITWTVHNYN